MEKILIEAIRELSKNRINIHKNHISSRPLSPEFEFIGLLGEVQFGIEFGLLPDLKTKPNGDGRIDFNTKIGSIDVKTAQKAYNLLREKNKKHANILVLAEYFNDDHIELIGWEYDEEMLKCPYKDFGYGVINHYKSKDKLKPIFVLKNMLNENKKIDEYM